MTTLFQKDTLDLERVVSEINPDNAWAIDPNIPATRKYDGTACAIIGGELYKRYDAKNGKPAPVGGIPCQEPDPISGHWPHWVKCDRANPADKMAFEGFDRLFTYVSEASFDAFLLEGTYELIGPKVQKNPEGKESHMLIRHGMKVINVERTFEAIRQYLTTHNIEGIVFHHPDGRMCKIRKSDFGIKRVPATPPTP